MIAATEIIEARAASPFLDAPVPIREPVIIAVAARKGGVGKTSLAYELAAAINAILVDLDWDDGGASVTWGTPYSLGILAALEGGKPPRIRTAPGRPAIVAAHPDLAHGGWEPGAVADHLEQWATAWGRPLVIDCHPGFGELATGAMQAARVVVIPAVLQEKPLAALAGMLEDHAGRYPLLLVPNLIPPIPPARQLRVLRDLAAKHGVPVAPPISAYPWWGRRARRSALILTPASKLTAPAVSELTAVAQTVKEALHA